MKSLNLLTDIGWHGHAFLEQTAHGLIPLRFLPEEIVGMGDMIPIARMQTGIELTLSGQIQTLTVMARCLNTDHYGITAELLANGQRHLPIWYIKTNSDEKGKTEPQKQTWTFRPDQQPVHIRLLLPTHCELEFLEVSVNDEAVIWSSPNDHRPVWIAHGDSITQGANVAMPSATWPFQAARSCDLQAYNLSIGGHGRAEPEMAAAIARRSDADLLSLHLGTNSLGFETADQFGDRLNAFISTIHQAQPELPIVVTSPIYRSRNGKDEWQYLAEYALTIEDVCDGLNTGKPGQIHFINGLSLLQWSKGYMSDGLHLDEHGASIFAQNFCEAAKIIFDTILIEP